MLSRAWAVVIVCLTQYLTRGSITLTLADNQCRMQGQYLEMCSCPSASVDGSLSLKTPDLKNSTLACGISLITKPGLGLVVTSGVVTNYGRCGSRCGSRAFLKLRDYRRDSYMAPVCRCSSNNVVPDTLLYASTSNNINITFQDLVAAINVQATGCPHDDLVRDSFSEIIAVSGGVATPGDYTVNVTCPAGRLINGMLTWTVNECQRSTVAYLGEWRDATVQCREAVCGAPDPAPHAQVSPNILSYSYGRNVTYSCAIGYQLTMGSANRTCVTAHGVGAHWSGEAPTCQQVHCERNVAIPNGQFRVVSTAYSSAAMVTCDPGYAMNGEEEFAQVFCQASGQWTDSPVCRLVECSPVPNVPFSSRAIDSPIDGRINVYTTNITYTCNSGYKPSGPSTVSCLRSGRWQIAPTCQLRACGAVPVVENAVCTDCNSTSTRVNSTRTYRCVIGYRMQTSRDDISCQPDGAWSTPPLCQRLDCGTPSLVPNGRFEPMSLSQSTLYNHSQSLTCYNGYYNPSEPTITCLADGLWSNNSYCIDIDCGEAPASRLHTVMNLDYTRGLNSAINYQCVPGYQFQGQTNHVTCQANSTWSPLPICIVKECEPPVLTNLTNGFHEIVYDRKYEYSETITVRCNKGFYATLGGAMRCTEHSSWSQMPQCLMVDCGKPPESESAKLVSFNATTLDSTAEYKCTNEGNGTTIFAQCEKSGEWSLPYCAGRVGRIGKDQMLYVYIGGGSAVAVIVIIILFVGLIFRKMERNRRMNIKLPSSGSHGSEESAETQTFIAQHENAPPGSYNRVLLGSPKSMEVFSFAPPQGSPPGAYISRSRHPLPANIYDDMIMADNDEFDGDEFLQGGIPLYAEKKMGRGLEQHSPLTRSACSSRSPTNYEPIDSSEPRTPELSRNVALAPQIAHSKQFPGVYPIGRNNLNQSLPRDYSPVSLRTGLPNNNHAYLPRRVDTPPMY